MSAIQATQSDPAHLLSAWIQGHEPDERVWHPPAPSVDSNTIARIPEDAGIRGLFVNGIIAHGRSLGVELPDRHKVFPFGHQPLRDLLALGDTILTTLRPQMPMARKLRIMGRWLFEYWSSSAVGKPLVASVGNNIKPFIALCTPGYRMTFTRGRTRPLAIDQGGALITFDDVVWGLDTVQVGIYDAFSTAFGVKNEMRIKTTGAGSGALLIRWQQGTHDLEDADLRMSSALRYRRERENLGARPEDESEPP